MSITDDIRSYADTAIEQGKQVLGTATGTVNDLRAQAEKTLNIDALRGAVEPYLAQARQYRSAVTTTVTDRAEGLLDTVKDDPRLARALSTAETMTGLVIDTVQQRIVKPVAEFTGHGASKPAPVKPTTPTTPTKSATTRSASSSSTAKKAPAKKAPVKTAPAKKAATARKAPAKKTTSS